MIRSREPSIPEASLTIINLPDSMKKPSPTPQDDLLTGKMMDTSRLTTQSKQNNTNDKQKLGVKKKSAGDLSEFLEPKINDAYLFKYLREAISHLFATLEEQDCLFFFYLSILFFSHFCTKYSKKSFITNGSFKTLKTRRQTHKNH